MDVRRRPLVIRIVLVVLGFGLLAAGVAMLVLPGPGWLTIFAALAILAGEFVWARRLLDSAKRKVAQANPTRRRSDQEDAAA